MTGKQTIAEWAENAEIIEVLRGLGVDYRAVLRPVPRDVVERRRPEHVPVADSHELEYLTHRRFRLFAQVFLADHQVGHREGAARSGDPLIESRIIPRFVVGMPRAGTTWLCHVLNSHDDVAAFGETMFWGKSYVEPGPDGCYDEAALQRVKASLFAADLESTFVIPGPGLMKRVRREDLPRIVNRSFETLEGPSAPSVVFTSFAHEMARAEGKSHWVEKTPHHLFNADRILRHLPEARFVVMIREPYSFMLSYKHYRGHENTAACSERFVRRYHPLACALVWRSSSRAAEDLARRMPYQTLVARLEEVESDPVNLVRRVRSFLLLPEDNNTLPAACKVNSAFGGVEKPHLSDSDIAWMNFVAGSAIESAGYERRLRSSDVYDVCRSIADLPAWVVRWLRDTKQTTRGSLRRHLWDWLVQQRKRFT